MRAKYYKQFEGKRIEWEYAIDHNRGTCLVGVGFCERVEGKNMWIDGDVKWGEDLRNIKELPEGEEPKL